tara:strand:- start:822 stop:1109 length:288 start_codon:yes stop_codon:yes gene_type:complete
MEFSNLICKASVDATSQASSVPITIVGCDNLIRLPGWHGMMRGYWSTTVTYGGSLLAIASIYLLKFAEGMLLVCREPGLLARSCRIYAGRTGVGI